MRRRTREVPALFPAALAVAALVLVAGGLTAAQGGYFPTSWGWASLGLVFVIEVWLLLNGDTEAGALEAMFVVGLACLLGWVTLSLLWSINPAQTVLEIERTLLLVIGCAGLALVLRRQAVPAACAALLATMTAVCAYGLATRLFPEQLGVADPIGLDRLAAPIGYWNGLGVFAAMGTVLALGLAASRSFGAAGATIAAAALVVLPVTLFFTFSRGALLAACVGLVALIGLSARRLYLLAVALVLLPLPLVGVLLAARSDALTRLHASAVAAERDGGRLTLALVALALAEIAIAYCVWSFGDRLRLPARVTRAVRVSIAIVVAAALVVTLSAAHPIARAQSAYHSFVAVTSNGESENGSLTERLSSFSSNGRMEVWRIAWRAYRADPLTGTGAGSFERIWQANPTATFKVSDAHSLYLETLTELGPLGLVLLLVTLPIPLAAAIAARRRPLVPTLAAAYVVFLVHAGFDWDWELSGVSLTALLIGMLTLAGSRSEEARAVGFRYRLAAMAVVVVIGVAALIGLAGNSALAEAQSARSDGRFADALAGARRARRLMPWSAAPWIAQGEAEYDAGATAAARGSFERAVRIDARDWRGWLELAVTSHGRQRTRALARAERLYPASTEVQEVRSELRSDTHQAPRPAMPSSHAQLGAVWQRVSGPPVSLDRWTYVAASYDGSRARLYVNGALVASAVVSYEPNRARPLRIGAGTTEGEPRFAFPGRLDEVAVYRGALASARVAAHYRAAQRRESSAVAADTYRAAVLSDGPTGYWRLGEGGGSTAVDETRHGHSGSYVGSPTLGSVGALSAGGDSAAAFDGIGQYVQLPYSVALNPHSFTIEAWVYPTGGTGRFRSIITSRDANPERRSGLMLYAGDTNTWQFWLGGGRDRP